MGNETHKTGRRRKRKDVNSAWVKMKKREVNTNQLLLKQRMKSTEHRVDSLGQIVQSVSVYEKGIILQSHKCVCVGVIQRAMAILMSLTV